MVLFLAIFQTTYQLCMCLTNIFGKNRNANEATVTYQRVYTETNISAFKNAVKNLS
jgi:hypothetical protein